MDIDLDKVRTNNFLRILRERYDNSPSVLEQRTGYSANMASQIKGGHKLVRDRLARKLEKDHLKLPQGTLDKVDSRNAAPTQQQFEWPFTISPEEFAALSPRIQNEIDDLITRQVIGAQTQEMLEKQQKKRRRS
jgi:hypothetical protein